MSGPVVAGVGLRRSCDAAEIVALVRRAAERAGRRPDRLAAPARRQDEPALLAASAALGVELSLVTDAALAAAQHRCVTRSAAALAAVGVASVAEGCALAAAGPQARLILPRIASAAATCALAGPP